MLLLDHAAEPGAKILISGGGRCNFTNLEADLPERYLSANPHFCKSALSRYTPRDFIAMVERHRIAYHEKTLGQLFCDGSAREILAMLLEECRAPRRSICAAGHRVTDIARNDRFRIETNRGGFEARALVIATGGLSIPKIGATGFAYDVARRFGLAIVEPRPGLVGLEFAGETLALCNALTGVSVGCDCLVRSRQLSREYPFHASRIVRSRDSADFVVLEKRRRALHRPGADASMPKLSCAIANARVPRLN